VSGMVTTYILDLGGTLCRFPLNDHDTHNPAHDYKILDFRDEAGFQRKKTYKSLWSMCIDEGDPKLSV
jgi:hypothetical protein